MKVLIAHPSTELYGSDRQLAESVAGFRAAGCDVTVALPANGPLTARLPGARVDVVQFPVLRKSELRSLSLVTLLALTPFVVLRLARRIRALAPDVVYVNTVTLPHWVAAARLARRPLLVHVHEAEEMSSPIMRRVLYAPLAAAHTVVVNSATTARVVAAACPRVQPRMVTVPNGVADPGARPGSAVVAGRVALVSRLSPRKGVDVALEAISLLRAGGRDVSVTICGSAFRGYEWFEAQLRDRAAHADLAGCVTFTGFVDSVLDWLAAAEVVIVPSFGESFGNAAVEGMLAGRPVVASDVQGLAEIFRDGHDGLLVPPGDAEALAEAIGRVLDDARLATALAERARAKATASFSNERYHRDIVAAAARAGGEAKSAKSRVRRRSALLAVFVGLAAFLSGCTSSGPPSTKAHTSAAGPAISGSNTAAASGGPSAVHRAPSVPRTPVPAPGSGNISQKVSPKRVVTHPAVALDAPAAVGNGVRVRVAAHRTITAKATRPGEVSGPATQLTLDITNGSSQAISLDDAVVNDTDSRGTPLVGLSGPPSAPFHGRLAAGKNAIATYVFVLADGRHNPYTISVSYNGQSAVVQFVGDLA